MGPGIEPGIWYSPFIVYDFNGDGKAEVAVKTAGDDYVKNEKGRVCGGSEWDDGERDRPGGLAGTE